MAPALRRLSKVSMLVGGALVVAAIVLLVAWNTTGTAGVSAQTTPAARTPTPAVVAPTVARTATAAAPAAAARTATPAAAPGKLPANGDSTTFPAVLIALLGAGLIGVGLTARYTFGKSRA